MIQDYKQFFSRPAEQVAPDLLGRMLTLHLYNETRTGRILETGAYQEGKITPSREGMLYSPGTLFLMPRRAFLLFNIATERENYPSCVEIRRVACEDRIVNGPGAVSKAFGITKDLDGILLGEQIQITGERVEKSLIVKEDGEADNCSGYFSIKT